MLQVQPIQRDGWNPLPAEGCRNVSVKMLMKLDHLGLAMLRFDPDATIHEHPTERRSGWRPTGLGLEFLHQ